MRTITKEYNVYNYNELKGDAIERATEVVYEILNDDRCNELQENLLEYISNEYKINLSDNALYYSLCNVQGDGVCFTLDDIINWNDLYNYMYKEGSYENLNAFEKVIVKQLSQKDLELVYEYVNAGYTINIKKRDLLYCHSGTCYLDYNTYCNDDEEYANEVNDCISKLCNGLLKDKYNEICNDLEKVGYSLLDISKDDILDYIENSEIEFYEDGNIASL